MIKILHTADWHLGKRLYRFDLVEEHRLFIDWLLETIKKEEINVLLVSGDIFDLANPSNEARSLYYETLVRLRGLSCKTIITGGNHDSPAVLNAPKELLRALDIHVMGGLPENLDDLLIPIEQDGETKCVIAAIPYLRDADLRKNMDFFSYEDKREAIRLGIKKVFDQSSDLAKNQYPETPLIGMGHLYAHGASTSDSEREIQIGNEAGVESSTFSDRYDYIALGHIHKPQTVNGTQPILYSGSPVSLSFSERSDQKRVILIELKNQDLHHTSIPVPVFRNLVKVSGSLAAIKEKLNLHSAQKNALKTLVELELIAKDYDPELVQQFESFVFQFESDTLQIVKHKASFENRISGTNQLFSSEQQIEELQPSQVFSTLLEKENIQDKDRVALRAAFEKIIEELNA